MTYMTSASAFTRSLNYLLIELLIAHRCEKTYKQNDRILEIIDLFIVSENNDVALKANLTELRCLVFTRPIKFHAVKFFTIDYKLLVSMCSVVVTYTIIMLQSLE
ncbi:unnamed protein product [Arctia plantaginis]|uniref:Gustatory receptor n=1 Tax=Arctia plantaginis TaxID=874455 RepID=A0A8S1BBV1_ARCPL|nr:unnamed protein product [Arctia plantaginis]